MREVLSVSPDLIQATQATIMALAPIISTVAIKFGKNILVTKVETITLGQTGLRAERVTEYTEDEQRVNVPTGARAEITYEDVHDRDSMSSSVVRVDDFTPRRDQRARGEVRMANEGIAVLDKVGERVNLGYGVDTVYAGPEKIQRKS